MLRAVHIFPEFSNVRFIEELRERYDPLFYLIRPHVTLVFPFESNVTTEEVRHHLQASVRGIYPFDLVLQGVTGASWEYIFLNVKFGNDQIIELHDRLYTGLLKQHLNRTVTFTPHLTVGRVKDQHAFQLALSETEYFNEVFKTTVKEIVVENISDTGMSMIEMITPLSW